MNDIGKRISYLRNKKKINQQQLANKLNVSSSTIAMWETNKRAIKDDNLIALADFFNVSTDYLLGRENLTKKEKEDLAIQADNLLEGIENGGDLNFYGEPASEEQKERLRVAIRTAMEMNKEEAKKKFNPKKNRK